MAEFYEYPTDVPRPSYEAPLYTQLPNVTIGNEGDATEPEELPYGDPGDTSALGVADDLEFPAEEPMEAAGAEAADYAGQVSITAEYGDSEPLANTVALPPDIHDLLDKATPAAMHQGASPKLDIPGHPELIARVETDTPYVEVKDAKKAADALVSHGVNVLPSSPVERGHDTYVVTQRVDGIPLEAALEGPVSPRLLGQIDRHWAGLATGLHAALADGKPFPADIVGPQQCMVGTTHTDPIVDVRMVDLPNTATPPSQGLNYEAELFDITRAVMHTEQQTGMELTGARDAIWQGVPQMRTLYMFEGAYTNAVVHMLITGEPLEPDIDSILRFRSV